MNSLDQLWQDTRVAWRMLCKNSGATALSILSIALGVGLTTALFSIVDAFLFRPAPFREPEQLFELNSTGEDGRLFRYSWLDYADMTRALEGVAPLEAVRAGGVLLARDEGYALVISQAVTPGFFGTLGVKPMLGQTSLRESDGQPQALISQKLWLQRFSGDRMIVGKRVILNRRAFTVAGVLPAEFTGMKRFVGCDIWISMQAWFDLSGSTQEQTQRHQGSLHCYLRLPPGVHRAEMESRLDAALRSPGAHRSAPAGSQGTQLTGSFAPTWREKLARGGALLPVFGLLLFVACANVAQMRLAQAEQRKREFGVRLALGSSPAALARLLLVETALVSIAGAAFGVVLSQEAVAWANAMLSAHFPMLDLGIRIDGRVLCFSLGATLSVLVFAGFAPARHAFQLNLIDVMQGAHGTHRLKTRWQTILIAGQTATSVLLFGLALLFLQSWHNASQRNPGFDPSKSMVIIEAEGRGGDRTEWALRACEHLASLPGVRGATFVRAMPLNLLGGSGIRARIERPDKTKLEVPYNGVGPNFFSLMGTRLVAGRGIEAKDRGDSSPVIVVSRSLARQLFGERNPLGETLMVEGRSREIVGVAEDAPSKDLHDQNLYYLYLPHGQSPLRKVTFLIETETRAEALIPMIQRELKRFDPDAIAIGATTLRQHMAKALLPDRIAGTSTAGLGVLGFILTAAGLFGVIQYTVNRRTREIGVRLALGATANQIQRLVLGESLQLVRWGVLAGLLLLGASSLLLRSALLDVSPLNLWIFACSASAAITTALLAAWLPARRATQVNPVEALRAE